MSFTMPVRTIHDRVLMPLQEETPMHSMTAYNPFAPEVKASPYPFYEWLRQEQPVYYNQEHDFWALSRYQDIVWAARTPEIFSSARNSKSGRPITSVTTTLMAIATAPRSPPIASENIRSVL